MIVNNENQLLELKSDLEELERGLKRCEVKYLNSWIEKEKNMFEGKLDSLTNGSDIVKGMIKDLFKFRVIDQKEIKKNKVKRLFLRENKSETETKILEERLSSIDKEELYKKYLEIEVFEEELKNKSSIDNKVKILRKILNSQMELESEKIRELKEEIDKLKERSLQREIEIIKKAISLLKKKESNEPLGWLKKEFDSKITVMTIKKTEKYLEVKGEILTARREVIKVLWECYNETNQTTNIEIPKEKAIIDGVASVMGITNVPVGKIGISLGKLGEAVSKINDYINIVYSEKRSKEFMTHLKKIDENDTDLLERVYNVLKRIIEDNEELEISGKIIEYLELKDKGKLLKVFEDRHNNFYNIKNKDDYLTLGDQKEKLKFLDEIFGDGEKSVSLELKKEKERIETLKKETKEWQERQEVPPKSNAF